jgi:hypothetical protein
MARKKPHLATVAFKVEDDLARLLNEMPNRSEFIRKAIAAQLGITCPLCHGKGAVSGWTHERFAPLIDSLRLLACAGCGDAQLVPPDPGFLSADDRARLEQFFHGGPLYCDPCFRAARPCGECGWRIEGDKINDHMRSLHRTGK